MRFLVNRQAPAPIVLNAADGSFLVEVAKHVLGNGTVAATNAERLIEQGMDAHRIDSLIPCVSVAVLWNGFVFKKVEADPESPENYGLFIRRAAE